MTPNVLFLCTGNSARSQMAEALLRKHAGDRFHVYSAGLEPKGINPLTFRVMQELGIDMSGHSSKSGKEYMGRMPFQYVITVCGNADKRCPSMWPGAVNRLHWPFDDPAEAEGTDDERMVFFRRVRDQIERKILAWLEELP